MRNPIQTRSPRRWFWIAIFLFFTILVSSRFTNARDLVQSLSKGIWQWIVAGVVIHIVYFSLYSFLYQAGFKTVGVQTSAWGLIPVVMAAIFINTVAPFGGVGGGALFVSYVAKQGQSGARAAVGLLLVLLADLATLIPFIIASLVYLNQRRHLTFYEILAVVVFMLFVMLLTGTIMISGWRLNYVKRALGWMQGIVNRAASWFGKEEFIGGDWSERTANELAAAAKAITRHPRELSITVAWGFITHLVNLVGLYAFFVAFRQPVEVGTLLAGFSLGIVFYVIAVIPQGVGAVEGIMGLVFTSMGISPTKAITIALAFRGVNFWMPLAVGMLVMPYISVGLEKDR